MSDKVGMNDSVGVIVSTFGDEIWKQTARTAIASAKAQTVKGVHVVHEHGDTLGDARNSGAWKIGTDWLIFLDADDTLDQNYVEKMLESQDGSTLRQPSTLGVYEDGTKDEFPVLIEERDLWKSNYLVIGSMCRSKDFWDVNGFDASLPVLEDWDLWCRIIINGAIVGKRPEAIYEIGVHPDSRNHNTRLHGRYYNQIRRKYEPALRHRSLQN